MAKSSFEYSTLAQGIYLALVWLLLLVSHSYPHYLYHYTALLLFLGLGLKPLLIHTGIYEAYCQLSHYLYHKLNDKKLTKLRRQIEQDQRDEKYRRSRRKDPRLPKNW